MSTYSTRRGFRRRAVQLEVSICFKPPPSIAKTGVARGLTLVGRTTNISESGMGLAISANNIDRYLKSSDKSFDVKLKLPDTTIEFRAAPVYYTRISSGAKVTYLIGARFTEIDERAHARLVAYLHCLTLPPRKSRD
jgi:hypothetical protein